MSPFVLRRVHGRYETLHKGLTDTTSGTTPFLRNRRVTTVGSNSQSPLPPETSRQISYRH